MTFKELQDQYNEQANRRKEKIRQEPRKFIRFLKWCWYLISYTWVWCWYNLRDWRTFVIFLLVMAVVGIEVWLPLLLGLILDNAWLIGIAVACETWWALPLTPFMLICIFITMIIKNAIIKRGGRNKKC